MNKRNNLVKISCIEILLLKPQLCWAGHISRMGNLPIQDGKSTFPAWEICLSRVILYRMVSTGLCDIGAPKKWFKDCLKNPLVPVTLTIANGPPELGTVIPAVSPPTMLSLSLKTLAGLLSRTKGTEGRTTIQCYQTLTSCDCCNHICLFCIGLIIHKHAWIWHESGPSQAMKVKPAY